MIISLIAELAGVFALLGLMWMKISLTAGTAFLRIAMPVAIVLWPIEEFSWLTRTASKAMFTCLVVPLIWALLFATFAALGIGIFHVPTEGNSWLDTFVRPLAADAILISAITIPKNLLKAAYQPSGGGRSGMASIAAYFAIRQGVGMLLGGRGGGGHEAPSPGPIHADASVDPLHATAQRVHPSRGLPSGRPGLAGGPSAGPRPGGPSPGGPKAPGGNPNTNGHGHRPPRGPANGRPTNGTPNGGPGPRPGRNGNGNGAGPTARPPSFDRDLASRLERGMRISDNKPTSTEVGTAQASLSNIDQWRLWDGAQSTGGQIRPLTAQMMAEHGRDPASRNALWTIGTASVPTRTEGMYQPSGTPPPGYGGASAPSSSRGSAAPPPRDKTIDLVETKPGYFEPKPSPNGKR
jgi:hypothetical protein